MKRLTLKYGEAPSQFGHLYLPDGPATRLVVLIHGGSWSTQYGLNVCTPIARDLVGRGAAVWNVEYRRVPVAVPVPGDVEGHTPATPSDPDDVGGWPTTVDDVRQALRVLPGLVRNALGPEHSQSIDWQCVALIGHSAGAQLAVLAAAGLGGCVDDVRFPLVIAQAGVLDMEAAGRHRRVSVEAYLGASYADAPGRYRDANPAAHLPFPAEVVLIHGDADTLVPPEMSEAFETAAAAAGQGCQLISIPGGGHSDFLRPQSASYRATLDALRLPQVSG